MRREGHCELLDLLACVGPLPEPSLWEPLESGPLYSSQLESLLQARKLPVDCRGGLAERLPVERVLLEMVPRDSVRITRTKELTNRFPMALGLCMGFPLPQSVVPVQPSQ